MNTSRELEIIKEMENTGELKAFRVDKSIKEPKPRHPNTPSSKTGYFIGKLGNSAFFPNSKSAKKILKQFSKDSVQYKNGYPDFSPFIMHKSKWGTYSFSIEIGHMTDLRKNTKLDDGLVETGNFTKAELAFCNMLSKDLGIMISIKEFRSWYKKANLSIHECEDGKTVQLVPTELHEACPHSGGVSTQRYKMAMGDVCLNDTL